MHVIIAGSRYINDFDILEEAIFESGFPIDFVVHGDAIGVDKMAMKWAQQNKLPSVMFKADWLQFNKRAGPIRNSEMIKHVKEHCECGGALIAIWNGESKRTFNIISQAYKAGLRVFVKTIINPGPENLKRRGKE